MKNSIAHELRSVQRYSASLPVCLTWRGPNALHPPLNALTRDISTRGMFVIADAEPAEGELLEFEIDLALDEDTPLVVVRGEGRVVRIERSSSQPYGFAVHNVWFQLCEPEQAQTLPLDSRTLATAAVQSPRAPGKTSRNHGLTIVPRQVVADSNQDPDQKELK